MLFFNWRAAAPLTLALALLSAPAEAGEARGTLRVTARVVDRCTFATRVPDQARAGSLRPRDLVEMRCGRNRPTSVRVAPFRPIRPIRVERNSRGRHFQVTITY